MARLRETFASIGLSPERVGELHSLSSHSKLCSIFPNAYPQAVSNRSMLLGGRAMTNISVLRGIATMQKS